LLPPPAPLTKGAGPEVDPARQSTSRPPDSNPAIPATPGSAAPVAPVAPGASIPPMAIVPAVPSASDPAALETDLQHVQMMFREYRDVVGTNPVGTNSEIMRAILGENVKQAKIGAPENQQLNEKGELVDRWGTPYFFHQLSGSKIEVRSAGPDRRMWTRDDMQQ